MCLCACSVRARVKCYSPNRLSWRLCVANQTQRTHTTGARPPPPFAQTSAPKSNDQSVYASLAAIGVPARVRDINPKEHAAVFRSVLLSEAVTSKPSCRSVSLFVGRLVMLFLLPLVLVVVLILLLTLPTVAKRVSASIIARFHQHSLGPIRSMRIGINRASHASSGACTARAAHVAGYRWTRAHGDVVCH